jgi:ring-1,2-phenylacetyl-CoA epoxidase subunit PaaD
VVSATAVPAARADIDEAAAWQALGSVLDPEVPVLSILELGIVRDVSVDRGTVRVIVTPTYSGCPATEAIQDAVRAALLGAGASSVHIELQYAPAWTTDWIAPAAAEKLRRYGIAPPHTVARDSTTHTLRFHQRQVACPRCESSHTERISEFGSTACKSLYRCVACREPFDYFKPI